MLRAAILAAALAVSAAPAFAANADQPYKNVDKTNDKGNDTGNGRVEDLNRGQLDQNQKPSGQSALGDAPQTAAPKK